MGLRGGNEGQLEEPDRAAVCGRGDRGGPVMVRDFMSCLPV